MTRSTRTRRALTALVSLMPLAAYAHHAMDYEAPTNLFEGFVSGLAHPVIGLDHFLFVIAIGAACYFFGRRAASPALFIAGTIGGTVLHLLQPSIAFHDVALRRRSYCSVFF
ncbi:MAG: HupE/UreJ family protein [Burkholderiales bacterium]